MIVLITYTIILVLLSSVYDEESSVTFFFSFCVALYSARTDCDDYDGRVKNIFTINISHHLLYRHILLIFIYGDNIIVCSSI